MKTRAAVLYSLDSPLRVESLEMPSLGAGKVLVEVKYSGLCHSQLMEVRGKRGPDRYLPHLLGHEGAGIVLETGRNVTKVRKGDSVVLSWIRSAGIESGGSLYQKGDVVVNAGAVTTLGERTVVSENRCVKVEASLPADVAALMGCAVLTGSGIVLNTICPKPHESILVWGVGGIGLSAIMAARLCECRCIIAVDVHDAKLQLARKFGATNTIRAQSRNVLEEIREIVGKEGVDYAVEAAGHASTIELAFASVRKNGGLCVFASHPPSEERISLVPHDLISGKNIKGSWGGEANPDRDIPRFVELYRQGKLPLEGLITHRYKLNDVNQALSDLERGLVGRPIIEME